MVTTEEKPLEIDQDVAFRFVSGGEARMRVVASCRNYKVRQPASGRPITVAMSVPLVAAGGDGCSSIFPVPTFTGEHHQNPFALANSVR